MRIEDGPPLLATQPPARDAPLPPAGDLRNVDDQSGPRHRRLIGYLGLSLSPSLWVVSAFRATGGRPWWQPLDSISAYFFSGATAIFSGTLASLAVFFFTYRGYANEWGRMDRNAGKVAAWTALGVAFFPTEIPNPPEWWSDWMGKLHIASAAVLFATFAFFALYLFRKTTPNAAVTDAKKKNDNWVYLACGLIIVACILCIGVLKIRCLLLPCESAERIFWPETIALVAFALSWLRKGRSRLALA